MSQVTEIVDQLVTNIAYHKEVQPVLRKFVTDTSYSLAERFAVWKNHCDKKNEPWVIHESDYGIIGKWVDDCQPYTYERYQRYNWSFFLEFVTDYPEDAGVAVEQFKELLIQTNFGSFKMDW